MYINVTYVSYVKLVEYVLSMTLLLSKQQTRLADESLLLITCKRVATKPKSVRAKQYKSDVNKSSDMCVRTQMVTKSLSFCF